MSLLKSCWLWLASLPSPVGEIILILAGAIAATIINGTITKPPGKKLGTHIYDKWMGFAEILQMIILSTILGTVYFLFVPFFKFLFMNKDDLLGHDLSADSYWHDSKEVEFNLRRTYKLY